MNIQLAARPKMAGIYRVGVTGGRTFADTEVLYDALDQCLQHCFKRGAKLVIVQGGANGADKIARDWVLLNKDENVTLVWERADWNKYGKAAGPKRNQRMIDKHNLDALIAVPGGAGTADMKRRATEAQIPIFE